MILRTKQAEAGGQVKNHWPNLTYYPSISLGRLRKTTIKFSQDSWSAVSWTQSRTANHLTTTVYILPSDTTQPSHFNFSYHLLLIPSVAHTVCRSYRLSLIPSVTHTICHSYLSCFGLLLHCRQVPLPVAHSQFSRQRNSIKLHSASSFSCPNNLTWFWYLARTNASSTSSWLTFSSHLFSVGSSNSWLSLCSSAIVSAIIRPPLLHTETVIQKRKLSAIYDKN